MKRKKKTIQHIARRIILKQKKEKIFINERKLYLFFLQNLHRKIHPKFIRIRINRCKLK